MYKVGMISLGCPKNQVDAEIMLKKLKDAGFELTPREDDADAIIINTCGFIESAKEEAIEAIIEAASYKKIGALKALIVTGCLAERYRDEITEEIPEADVVCGIGANDDIADIVKNALTGRFKNYYGDKSGLPLSGGRILTTPPYTAYLKIAEGCSNNCTYCAIPSIRGPFRSRQIEDIVEEAGRLAADGVSEITLVAQDTTRYGEDLYGAPKLSELLRRLCKIDGLFWIRTLYTYPERIDDELIETVRSESKLVKYFDIPIQHADDVILKRMNRRSTRDGIIKLIEKLRREIPNVTLRTSLITGFPGESEEQFTTLAEFVKQIRFDRLGCFAYSEEEDTPAAGFKDQVDRQLREDRAENIMNEQNLISAENNMKKAGSILTVLTEGYDSYIKCYYGRSEADAPEIDGKVFFTSGEKLAPGDYVKVKINDCIEYDLLGEYLDRVKTGG